MKSLFISLIVRFWEVFIWRFIKSIKKEFFFVFDNKKVVFLEQKIVLDIGEKGKLNRIKVENTIMNVGKGLISKYNHLLRCDLPALNKAKILAFDDKGLLLEPEMIEKNPQMIDFYVLFRKSLKPKEKYTYTWMSSNIEKFFDFSYSPLTWEWTFSTKVLKLEMKIYHPSGFKVSNVLVISKTTNEEIGIAKTKFISYNRELTEIILTNCPQDIYEIRWSYSKDS